MTKVRPLSSVGQSTILLIQESMVRIHQGSQTLGISVARYRASFGSQRPSVRIWHPQPRWLALHSKVELGSAKLEYGAIGQRTALIRRGLKVRVFLFQHTSAQCNGSIPVSKTVCKGSNPLVGANWFFGVTDSTKRYGRFSKGSNPLGTTN